MPRLVLLLSLLVASLVALAPAAPAAGSPWAGSLGHVDAFTSDDVEGPEGDGVAVAPDGRHVYVTGRYGSQGRSWRVGMWERRGDRLVPRRETVCRPEDADRSCSSRAPVPRDASRLLVTGDGRTVLVAGDGVTALQRDPATGRLSAAPDGCLTRRGERCPDGALPPATPAETGVRIVAPGDGSLVHVATGTRVLTLRRDPATSALTLVGCAAPRAVEGCTAGQGDGWAGTLAVDPSGRSAIAADLVESKLTIANLVPGPDGALRQADGPAAIAFTATACCSPMELDLSPDGRMVVVSTGERIAAVLRRDPATGALFDASCGAACADLVAPVAFSPDGSKLYATVYLGGDGESLDTYAHLTVLDADTVAGRLVPSSRAPRVQAGQAIGEDPLRDLAFTPDGRWLLTEEMAVLGIRRVAPPRATVRPSGGSCLRGRRARLSVGVTGRAAGSPVEVLAHHGSYNPVLGKASSRSARTTVRVRLPRRDRRAVLVETTATGRDGVLFTAVRTVRRCR